MKKILLAALLFTAFAGYSQVKEPQKENQQSGDIIIERYDGEIEGNEEKPINAVTLPIRPEYPGGVSGFFVFINKNIIYENLAPEAKGKEVKGSFSFVIEKDGTMTNIEIVIDPGYKVFDELHRILSKSEIKWTPGQQANGTTVRAKCIYPIRFTVPN